MKTPNRFMQGLIALALLAMYAAALFLPVFVKVDLDPGLLQTLMTLTVAAVMYFIGTSSGSAKKDDTIAGMAKKD